MPIIIRGGEIVIEKEKAHESTKIKHIIGVMSGKGGVGKSSVTSLLALALQAKGFKVGIMDADITGPSIPKVFGLKGKIAQGNSEGLFPVRTVTDIPVMSINVLMDDEDRPVIWRGPLIAGTVKQFYTDVLWGELDYLLIDLPPGTGDVPLTVMQSLPMDGMVIVSTPQDLVGLIVKKSINMVKSMGIPLLGLIENMSYMQCPKCDEKIYLFGQGRTKQVIEDMDIELLATLPIDPEFTQMCDEGRIEVYGQIKIPLDEAAERISEKTRG
jgi:Mrp family chromosome partitioning ATPase